jgi:hypothetical protein
MHTKYHFQRKDCHKATKAVIQVYFVQLLTGAHLASAKKDQTSYLQVNISGRLAVNSNHVISAFK